MQAKKPTCCVAAREDVGERTQEAVLWEGGHDLRGMGVKCRVSGEMQMKRGDVRLTIGKQAKA